MARRWRWSPAERMQDPLAGVCCVLCAHTAIQFESILLIRILSLRHVLASRAFSFHPKWESYQEAASWAIAIP